MMTMTTEGTEVTVAATEAMVGVRMEEEGGGITMTVTRTTGTRTTTTLVATQKQKPHVQVKAPTLLLLRPPRMAWNGSLFLTIGATACEDGCALAASFNQ